MNHNKIIYFFSLMLFLCFTFSSGNIKAQSTDRPLINVNLSLTPPYSPFLSDYTGINGSKVLLILTNQSSSEAQIKLTLIITGDNGVTISTKPNYTPTNPLIFNGLETKSLNGLMLTEIFNLNNLVVSGIDRNTLIRTSRLPEGNYTVCIMASEIGGRNGGTPIGGSPIGGSPIGSSNCSTITINYPDAPILINPVNNGNVVATTPQNILFNWINAGNVPIGTQYQLQVAEMPTLTQMDPNQLLNASSYPVINKTLTTTSYLLNPSDIALKSNTKYAWRVKAIDPRGYTTFKNDGFSAASTFKYGVEENSPTNNRISILTENLASAPIITSPRNNSSINQTEIGKHPNISISWTAVKVDYPVNYEAKIIRVPNGVTVNGAIASNLAIYTKTTSNTSLTFNPNVDLANSDFETAALNGTDKYLAVVKAVPADTAWFYAEQKRLAKQGKLLQLIENNGQSNPANFVYIEKQPIKIVTPVTTTISGKLRYRFKETNEKAKNTALNFPSLKSKTLPLEGSNRPKTYDYYDYDEFPNAIGYGIFTTGANAKPLANTTIELKYAVYTSTTKTPSAWNDLTWLKSVYNPSGGDIDYETYTLKLDGETYTLRETLGVTKTKSDGSYTANFPANYKFGYLGSKDGLNYFGGVQILVQDLSFTTPDLLAFPKAGQSINIPDDIVFPITRNIKAKVIAAKNISNQALSPGVPIANYSVQIVEGTPTLNTPNYQNPSDGKIEDYKNQFTKINGADHQILDITKTDANGFAYFLGIEYSHSHKLVALNSPFEGTITYNTTNQNIDAQGTVFGINQGYRNSTFNVQEEQIEMQLQPKLPEIYLRAINIQNGINKSISGADVVVLEHKDSKTDIVYNYKTDENGYLKITNLNPSIARSIYINKAGYATKVVATNKLIVQGERFPSTVEQELITAGKLEGYVVDEKNNPIVANIKVGDGPFVKTNDNGKYSITNVPIGYQSIEVVPVVSNFFGEKFNIVSIRKDGLTTKFSNVTGNTEGKIVLTEKLHRVQFKLVDTDNKLITTATVSVGKDKTNYKTNASGTTSTIALASPDDEFKVSISAANYVKYEDYQIIPLSKTAKTITITLKNGQSITGKVIDAKTKLPIANARVYTISGTNADGEIQTESYTDAQGNYTLKGIESALGILGSTKSTYGSGTFGINLSTNGITSVKVYAVKSGSEAYVRQEVSSSAGLIANTSIANFELQSLGAKAEVWGIPIEVNKMTYSLSTTVLAGNFVNIPDNKTFAIKGKKLPFTALQTKFSPDNQTKQNVIEPTTDKIQLELTELKVTAFDLYDFEILGTDTEKSLQKINIVKENGKGTLKGYLASELSSFVTSYNYDGKFQLYNTTKPIGQISLQEKLLPILYADKNTNPATSYGISALYGKSTFDIHLFKASLASGNFDASGFSIDANLHLKIPLIDKSTIPAGQIKINTKEIKWQQYTGDINLPLEKWGIKGKGLSYEINQGAFKVIDGTLLTNLPQLPLNNILIYPQTIDLGETKLNGKESMTLAGVTPLYLKPDTKLTLVYDAVAPFDQKPHYRINFTGKDEIIAYAKDLPAIGAETIDIKMLSSYSDGKHSSIILKEKSVKYFNVVSQTLSGIEVGDGYFSLIGDTELNIPGSNNNITGRFKFIKDGKSGNGSKNGISLYVDKLDADIELCGKVRFSSKSFTISDNLLTVVGKVAIYQNAIEDAIQGIDGLLTKNSSGAVNDIKMVFAKDQKITMENKEMLILKGGSTVNTATKKWSYVNFDAQLLNFKQGQRNQFKEGEDKLSFEVKGGLETSGSKIELNDIDTPFGDLKITFDFKEKIFIGTLTVTPDKQIPLGSVTITRATVDLQIDRNGFLIVGAATNANLNLPLPDAFKSGYKVGLAIGYYAVPIPSYLKAKLLNVTLYNELPETFNTGVKGVYVNVMKTLDKSDLPPMPGATLSGIPGVGAIVPTYDFSAGMDLRFYLNVVNGLTIGVDGKAFANASCYYDLMFCNIGFEIATLAKMELLYTNKILSGQMLFDFKGKLIYCVGNAEVGILLQLLKPTDGGSFKFNASLKTN